MNNLINFEQAKKRFDLSVVEIGDTVEWEDFNGEVYQNVVTAITYNTFENTEFAGTLTSFPLWEKRDYVVHLENGLHVVGSVIQRKVVRGQKKPKDAFEMFFGGSHAN